MISALPAFFANKFVQYRYSKTVAGSVSGYVHTIAPVWAHALLAPPASITRVLPGGATEAVQVVPGYGCEADIIAPSDVPSFYVPFPFLGAMHWEEAAVTIPTMPSDTVGIVALTDAFTELPTLDRRAEVSFDCLLVYPGANNVTAFQQSQQVGDIVGHLREAAHNAGAAVRGVVELAHLGNRVADENEFPNELFGIRFRLFIKETVNNYKSYGLQV